MTLTLPHFTPREIEAAKLALEYYPIKVIARKMQISYSNAGVSLFNIRQKLGVRCHSEMIVTLMPFKDSL